MYDLPITTIVTPADNYDLTDIATVKDELDISDTKNDTFLARAITQCSATVSNYCNRTFAAETVQDLYYRRRVRPVFWRSDDPYHIQLSRWPIVSVVSIVETDSSGNDTTLVQGTDYELDIVRGWLTRLDSTSLRPMSWFAAIVTAQYEAGYETIPADVVDAVLRLVTGRNSSRGRDPALRQQDQTGIGSQSWWIGAPPMRGSLPAEIASILDNYRVPVTG